MLILLLTVLTLNDRIDDYYEKKLKIGTVEEVEVANAWDRRVYLATYPRSGNHWMRYLIEEATGIATASVYIDPDPPHLPDVFPWGGYCMEHGYEGNRRYPEAGEIAVVKTHYPSFIHSRFDELPYEKTIRIIRHPVDSFYSLYRWEQDYFQQPLEELVPQRTLSKYIQMWRRFQEYWDRAPNVLTIRYEDLYEKPLEYLTLVLEAMGYQVSAADVERAVQKYPPTGGLFKHNEHFTMEDLDKIEIELKDLMELYGYELNKILPIVVN